MQPAHAFDMKSCLLLASATTQRERTGSAAQHWAKFALYPDTAKATLVVCSVLTMMSHDDQATWVKDGRPLGIFSVNDFRVNALDVSRVPRRPFPRIIPESRLENDH